MAGWTSAWHFCQTGKAASSAGSEGEFVLCSYFSACINLPRQKMAVKYRPLSHVSTVRERSAMKCPISALDILVLRMGSNSGLTRNVFYKVILFRKFHLYSFLPLKSCALQMETVLTSTWKSLTKPVRFFQSQALTHCIQPGGNSWITALTYKESGWM